MTNAHYVLRNFRNILRTCIFKFFSAPEAPFTANAKIYVSLFPCNECAKAIIQSGIKEVVYWEDKYADTDGVKASKKMFELTGVKIRRYIPTNREITIRL